MKRRQTAAVWLLTIVGCLWLGLFPLLCGGTYAHITHDKWIIALSLGGLTTLIWLVSLLCGRKLDPGNPVRLLAVLYFAWMGASAIWGSHADLTNAAEEPIVWIGSGRYEGMATQLCYLAVFLGMSLYRPRTRAVLGAAAAGLVVYIAFVGVQYTNVNPLGLFPEGRSILLNYEFQGTIGNIDMVSGYVMLIAPMLLAAWLLLAHRRSWPLLVVGLAGVLYELLMEVQGGILTIAFMSLLMLGVMLTRPDVRARGVTILGGMLVCLSLRLLIGLPWLDEVETLCLRPSLLRAAPAATGGLIMLCALPLRAHPGPQMKPAAVLCLLLALCIAAVALVALLPIPDTAGGVYEIHEVLNGRPQDEYGSWRIGVWRHALHLAAESPVFGHGPDTFYPILRPHLYDEGAYLGENFDNPHNMYLAILVNNGVPGLALYLLLLLTAAVRCIRRRDDVGRVLFAGVLAYAVQGFFTFSICLVTPMFWALFGMACAPELQNLLPANAKGEPLPAADPADPACTQITKGACE